MKPNNEEIIRITADLQGHIRQGLVELIQSGAKLGSLHPVLECFNALDRVVQELAQPMLDERQHFGMMNESPAYWQGLVQKLQAELGETKAELREVTTREIEAERKEIETERQELARVRAEIAQIRAEESHA